MSLFWRSQNGGVSVNSIESNDFLAVGLVIPLENPSVKVSKIPNNAEN